ncbi:hypothetical protein ACSLVQ_27860, partial [Klebsiella pneumoniae]|uniref:hypothetical protein n=1 Tax=Klebsiella pneumoniae TaxID=573 RepID=UPI003EDE8219
SLCVAVFAAFRVGLGGADDEGAAGGFDDVVGDDVELVDLQDTLNLWEEPCGAARSSRRPDRER